MKHILILFLLAASVWAAKPSATEKKLLATTFNVVCMECDPRAVANYHLKPKKVTPVGARTQNNINVVEVVLDFKCPKRHRFSARGPDQLVPILKAEEVK